MRLRYLTAGVVLGVLLSATALGKAHRLNAASGLSTQQKLTVAQAQVRHDRAEISRASERRWLLLSPLPGSVLSHRWWLKRDVAYVQRLRSLLRPAHYQAWLCIHRGEGSWTDPNPPFWGGLQFDYGFQQTYGPELLRSKGTADHWTPLEQMQVAERAWRTRGFYPWPNTARACGLL